MDDRVSKLEDVVVTQQKSIEYLLEMFDLLNKRINLSNNRIDALKQFSEANADMIKSSNDAMMELFKLIKGD